MFLDDALAAELETVTVSQALPPSAPYGWGRDLSCVDDITADCAEVDPLSSEAIAQACWRRITTVRGSLPDDLDYGIFLEDELSKGFTPTTLRMLLGRVKGELLKDDRVTDADVVVTSDNAFEVISLTITVTTADPSQSFTLTGALDSDGAKIVDVIYGAIG